MGNGKVSGLVYLYVSIAILLWGFSFIWTNDLIGYDVPIFVFIFMRMAIAGSLMVVISKVAGKLQKIRKKDLKWFFLMSFFEPFIYFIGESYGLKITNSATLSAVIIATIPLFSLIIGQILYKEKLTGLNIAGIIITLPGVILFVWSEGSIKAEYYYGILFLLLAVLGAVGYSAVCKKLTENYNAFTITTYQFVIAALFFLTPFIIWGLPEWKPEFLSFRVLKPLLFLAVLCSCLAFVLYVKSMEKLGMTRTVIFTSLIPAISAIGAYFSGREVFSIQQILGMVIALGGVILAQYKKPDFFQRSK
ncbi:MAG: DMT family transporter [Bacteroidales bacterium]|nr:DMT family transporter [Bacteroidales bacterium]MDD4671008.1 DMT family transporter [Bacteroidales bacterium]